VPAPLRVAEGYSRDSHVTNAATEQPVFPAKSSFLSLGVYLIVNNVSRTNVPHFPDNDILCSNSLPGASQVLAAQLMSPLADIGVQ
jgi:hypothetical protein